MARKPMRSNFSLQDLTGRKRPAIEPAR